MEDKPVKRDAAGKFQDSGNPKGRPIDEMRLGVLSKVIDHYTEGDKFEQVMAVLDNLIFVKKSVHALRLLFEFIMGKPEQAVKMNSDAMTRIVIEHVRPPAAVEEPVGKEDTGP